MSDLARTLLIAGVVLIAAGLLLALGARLGLGRLPGDFLVRRGNVTCLVPIASSILLSLLLTLILWVVRR